MNPNDKKVMDEMVESLDLRRMVDLTPAFLQELYDLSPQMDKMESKFEPRVRPLASLIRNLMSRIRVSKDEKEDKKQRIDLKKSVLVGPRSIYYCQIEPESDRKSGFVIGPKTIYLFGEAHVPYTLSQVHCNTDQLVRPDNWFRHVIDMTLVPLDIYLEGPRYERECPRKKLDIFRLRCMFNSHRRMGSDQKTPLPRKHAAVRVHAIDVRQMTATSFSPRFDESDDLSDDLYDMGLFFYYLDLDHPIDMLKKQSSKTHSIVSHVIQREITKLVKIKTEIWDEKTDIQSKLDELDDGRYLHRVETNVKVVSDYFESNKNTLFSARTFVPESISMIGKTCLQWMAKAIAYVQDVWNEMVYQGLDIQETNYIKVACHNVFRCCYVFWSLLAAHIVDLYTLGRIFRSFNNQVEKGEMSIEPRHIMYYGGMGHVDNMLKILQDELKEKIKVQTIQYQEVHREISQNQPICTPLTSFLHPLFPFPEQELIEFVTKTTMP